MSANDQAAKLARELRLVLECYPEVSAADLARSLTVAPKMVDGSWKEAVEPIIRCSQAFGLPRNFDGQRTRAIEILSAEFNVPRSWTSLNWNQLPGVVAWQLLTDPRGGPARALEILDKYRLEVPMPGRKSPSPGHGTVRAATGIISADET